jgi:hypothetical protein
VPTFLKSIRSLDAKAFQVELFWLCFPLADGAGNREKAKKSLTCRAKLELCFYL